MIAALLSDEAWSALPPAHPTGRCCCRRSWYRMSSRVMSAGSERSGPGAESWRCLSMSFPATAKNGDRGSATVNAKLSPVAAMPCWSAPAGPDFQFICAE